MAEEKKTVRRRARTKTGAFKADDPSTPDVNEAWEEVPVEKPAAKKAEPKPAPAPKAPEYVIYESREKEPSMFPVAGINPIRNFQSGRLEYRVPADDLERFARNHFVGNGRVVRKA
jgi:hypothetical protein